MDKITDDTIRQTITSTLIETFKTMMSMDLEAVEDNVGTGLEDRRMVGTIHFGGEVAGVMSVNLSEAFARTVTSAMRGIEADEIKSNEAITDVIGELANIVAGNLKTEFLDVGLTCVISTPSITSGSDFKIDPIDIAPPVTLAFREKDEYVQVELCAKEEIGAKEDMMSDLSSEVVMERIAGVDIKTAIVNSVIDVFYTMLDMQVEAIQQVPESFVEEMRTVGSVTFAGEVDGLLNIQVNDDFGRQMTAAMLGVEIEKVESEQEVYDVIREVSNIIGGNLKSNFVDAGLSCILSTPSITNGRDFKVNPTHFDKPTRFLFSHKDSIIIVETSVKREKSTAVEGSEEAAEKSAQAENVQTVISPSTDSDVDQFKNLGLVMDIPLQVTVELGRSRKRINDVLKMGPGSVVELEQMEGEPVDILINQTLIAKGFVVVEKEKYGIRISEIVSRKERMKSMR
ncbi:flagellar motor switch protein FliN [Desulfosarcina sp.]|uniref:flagellar motor switch protein FliN n=1 Tax=Desulfosarcina sp. TaxID=2027861 RepID=UPI0029AB4C5E|nr:flagellar motor switch protein FliN [Desulfosarcina sp.]MDX2454772.1 flagellar motor switch protein FliN [Desulfosarcina sp.]MDX2492376.1 flagellar motor switch protein FliN [Desulfosarcina sp.]